MSFIVLNVFVEIEVNGVAVVPGLYNGDLTPAGEDDTADGRPADDIYRIHLPAGSFDVTEQLRLGKIATVNILKLA